MNLFSISEISISYHPKFNPAEMPHVKSSMDCFDILKQQWDDDLMYRESFAVLFLNRANKCIGFSWISKGGTAGTVADPKMIFQAAMKANAASLILAHNHPSQNLKPSQNDVSLTKKIKAGGNMLDMPVLDHLILGKDSYYSFADEGIM